MRGGRGSLKSPNELVFKGPEELLRYFSEYMDTKPRVGGSLTGVVRGAFPVSGGVQSVHLDVVMDGKVVPAVASATREKLLEKGELVSLVVLSHMPELGNGWMAWPSVVTAIVHCSVDLREGLVMKEALTPLAVLSNKEFLDAAFGLHMDRINQAIESMKKKGRI